MCVVVARGMLRCLESPLQMWNNRRALLSWLVILSNYFIMVYIPIYVADLHCLSKASDWLTWWHLTPLANMYCFCTRRSLRVSVDMLDLWAVLVFETKLKILSQSTWNITNMAFISFGSRTFFMFMLQSFNCRIRNHCLSALSVERISSVTSWSVWYWMNSYWIWLRFSLEFSPRHIKRSTKDWTGVNLASALLLTCSTSAWNNTGSE